MAFSYSGVINYGKATLPSVESWGSNNNILRDPPKSITTRRIDKVSDTYLTDQDIQDSNDRIAESINVYPRGVNVMVGVSFDNHGSNGGQREGQALLYGSQQAKLPYRIMKDGAFRPPIFTAKDLLPLSRLPRNVTKIDPIAYTADFQKKLLIPGTAKDYRSVKDDTLSVQATAPKMQYIRKPSEIGVMQSIQPTLIVQGETLKTQNIARPVEIDVRQNIQPHYKYQYSTLKSQRKETPVEIGVNQNIQAKLAVQGNTLKTQNVARPVEIAANQNIQDKLSIHGNTPKTQNVARPVEVAAKQNIQDKLAVVGSTQKTQKQDRPVEVSGKQSIQDKLVVHGETIKTQRRESPVEISVGQNIQSKLMIQGDTLKTQNIARPVEITVDQNIQNKLAIQGTTLKTQNIAKPSEVGVRQNIQDKVLFEAPGTKKMIDFSKDHDLTQKFTGDSVKDTIVQYNTQTNPSQNINKITVKSKITYHMNEKPQAEGQTNLSGITKYTHHEKQEIKIKPELSGEIPGNASMKGISNPNLVNTKSEAQLHDKIFIGGKESTPMIPSTSRTNDRITLKSKSFTNMMKKKNNF